ncbi:MAG: lantibiotic immunity ABC transporter MutE/EpiE family permease subunit [Lachnospiraceae bacterium]|nr:lantibiotic immunity ABC transporter MutE/EpiE family permease subunit [Lachnospiraceae bacterium]
MLSYLKAENLKCNRTFAKKLTVIAPVCMLLLAGISGKYFVQNGYNWWYTMILPSYITLLTALINQYEEKKLRYRAVFALPVDLKKVWVAKVAVIGIYVAIANIILLIGIIFGKLLYNTTSAITYYQAAAASMLLIITSLWQIPLCLFLSKKFGLLITILLNVGGGIILEIYAATKPAWFACPYSWATRLMCPVLGIQPNGLLVENGSELLKPAVIPIGILLSLALFAALLFVTANWFPKQEVK